MKTVVRLLVVLFAFAAAPVWAADADPLDHALGQPGAPVTVYEYASLTCPHCAHFHELVLPRLQADWIGTGKVKLVYRDFPTPPVNMSLAASVINHCAGPMRYFGVLSLLFRDQEKWMSAANPLDEIKRIVRVAGMTSAQVDDCLSHQDVAKAIQARAEEGNRLLGVDSTPSLVIAGKVMPGLAPYEDITKALEEAYKAAVKK